MFSRTDLGHADPLLQELSSLLAAQPRRTQTGREDGIGQPVKLADGGADRPTNTFPPFFIPLGPQWTQAVIRDQAHKQLLIYTMDKCMNVSILLD